MARRMAYLGNRSLNCIQTFMDTYVDAYMYACMCVYVYGCKHVSMYAWMYVCLYRSICAFGILRLQRIQRYTIYIIQHGIQQAYSKNTTECIKYTIAYKIFLPAHQNRF